MLAPSSQHFQKTQQQLHSEFLLHFCPWHAPLHLFTVLWCCNVKCLHSESEKCKKLEFYFIFFPFLELLLPKFIYLFLVSKIVTVRKTKKVTRFKTAIRGDEKVDNLQQCEMKDCWISKMNTQLTLTKSWSLSKEGGMYVVELRVLFKLIL